MPPRKRLGQLLTELGVIDEHQLQSALGHQKQWGGKIGTVLVQKGFCKEAQMISALSQHLGMPCVQLSSATIDPRAVKFVSRQVAEKLHVFPYEVSGSGRAEVVTIAMSDPTDLSAVDQLAFHTGKRIKPILAGDSEIVSAIQAHYGGDEKKPAAAAPAGPPQPAAPAAPSPWRVAPPGPSPASPRATPAAATPAQVAPVAPPPAAPAPAAAQAEQQLEEIEPEDSLPPQAPAEPLDLPADDGEEMGLEPIAAHSQFGDAVAGQEDISGEGSPVDAIEGLEPAGVRHEGAEAAAQAPGETVAEVELEPIEDLEEPEPQAAAPQEAPADRTGDELPADAVLGSAESAEAPDAWGSTEDPLAGHTAQFSSLPEPPPEGVLEHPTSPTTDKFALAAAEELPEEPQLEDLPELQGWVAPQAEPEPEPEPETGWSASALEAGGPLSAADLGTLASAGIDANDGVAALRLLAALLRVLNRRQLLDLDEVAAEVHESRARAASEENGMSASGHAEPADPLAASGEPAET